MERVPLEKRKRGRPRTTWEIGIWKMISERNLTEEKWNNKQELAIRIRQQCMIF
jgi:hypothetical protein